MPSTLSMIDLEKRRKLASVRLDQLLVQRGLFASREAARRAVMAGTVEVEGRRVDKPGTAVREESRLAVVGAREPFVSRAGRKLAAALDHFAVDFPDSVRPGSSASTSAPRPAASPTACCNGGRPASTPWTWATASSTCGCGTIRGWW